MVPGDLISSRFNRLAYVPSDYPLLLAACKFLKADDCFETSFYIVLTFVQYTPTSHAPSATPAPEKPSVFGYSLTSPLLSSL